MKIIRFRGIPIQKIFSDDEYVEKIQKNLKRSKKYFWFHIALLILLLLCLPMLWDTVMGIIQQMTDKERMMAWLGLMIGLSMGIMIAQYVMVAGYSILTALDLFDFNRSNKLLIKYHEILKEDGLLEDEDKEQDEDLSSEVRIWN